MGFFSSFDRRLPDIIVLGLKLEGDGLVVLKRIKQMRVGAPVFVIAESEEVNEAVAAMKAGAHDIVTRPIDTERFVQGVREALRQDVHIGPVQGGRRPVEIRGFTQLTPREREVLQFITNGQSNKETGRALGISPRTVEVHRARVMEKLGARNTADLMRIVLTS